MPTPILPSNLESGGSALAARSNLERSYEEAVEHEINLFAAALLIAALLHVTGQDGAPAPGKFREEWAKSADKLERMFPSRPQLVKAALDMALINEMITAAAAAGPMSQQHGLTPRQSASVARVMLGQERNPAKVLPQMLDRLGLAEAEYGRVISPNGSSSIKAASQAMARTAATADFATAMIEQLRSEGYTHKRWNTRYDSKVRPTHAAVDRTTIPLDDVFTVGGYPLRHPGDSLSGAISEIAGCRCVLVGVNYGRHELDHPVGTTPWNNPRPF